MRAGNITLFSNDSAGNGTAYAWQGGKGMFAATATFGGGSVKLQFLLLNGTYVDVASCTLTAAGTATFELPIGWIRAVGTTASGIYAYAHPM
jgi:hypothetical protein